MVGYNLLQTPLLIATIVYVSIVFIALVVILFVRTDSRIENLIQSNTRKVKVKSQKNVTSNVSKIKKVPVRQSRPATAYSSTKSVARS